MDLDKAFESLPTHDLHTEFESLPGGSDQSQPATTAGHAALLGAAQGATFNNADEIGGLAGALGERSVANNEQGLLGATGEAVTSIPALLGLSDPTEFSKAYHNIVPEVRQDFQHSEEEHPYATLGGNVGGALLSGKLLAGALPSAAKGTTLAEGVAGPINQASALQNISNAAQVGGVYGGLSGAGSSTADLSQGQYGQLAKDTELGGLIGAGTGGLLQGAGEGLKATGRAIGNSEIGQGISHAFGRGKEGVDLVTKGAPEQEIMGLADKVINSDTKDLSQKVINEYNIAKQSGKPDEQIVQVLKDKYLPIIKELNADPSTQGKAIELLNTVQDIVEGKPKLVSANATTFSPNGGVSTQTKTGFVRPGGASQLSPTELVELEKKTGSQSYGLNRPGVDSRVQELAKDLDQAVTEATNTNVPGIAKAREMRSVQGDIENTLKPDTDSAVSKLINKVKNYDSNIQTKSEVDTLLDNINKIDPSKAAELKEKITTLSKDMAINKSINQKGIIQTDLAGKIGQGLGAKVGSLFGPVGTAAGGLIGKKALSPYTIANAGGRTFRAISAATPDQVKQLASTAMQTSTEVGSRVGNILNSIADAPFEKRNAVLFSLQQNVAYRQFLREHFDVNENE